MLIPCRCSSFSSCTSRPLSKFRNLLHAEWVPVYHARGGEFSTGTLGIFTPALTHRSATGSKRIFYPSLPSVSCPFLEHQSAAGFEAIYVDAVLVHLTVVELS